MHVIIDIIKLGSYYGMRLMKTFKYQKLCRDKIRLMGAQEGSVYQWYYLDNEAYDTQLRNKLQEEAEEVVGALNSKDLVEELADVQEIIDALCVLHGITKDVLLAEKVRKSELRGDFLERIFVETATHPVGSRLERYCSSFPVKYPEVINE